MDSFATVNANAFTGGGTNALDIVSKNALKTGDRAIVAVGGQFYYFMYDADRDDAENINTHPYIVRPDNFTTEGVWVECTTSGSGGLSLGETETTAYRGDRGKAGYDHAQIATGNPHGTTNADLGAEPAFVKLPIAKGGTNNDTFTSGKLLYYDGSKIVSSGLDIPRINDIGTPGQWGYGVGICDPTKLPVGMVPMSGCYDKLSPNYGNYMFENNCHCVYIPKHYQKVVGLLHYTASIYDYTTTVLANAAGYALPQAFINNGVEVDGFFIFKGKATKVAKGTGFIAGCILPGLPISTHADHNPILDLTACTANNYANTIDAAKGIDGDNGAKNPTSKWTVTTIFMYAVLAFLSMVHSESLLSADNMGAWWGTTTNYPKGCNNNALKDANDATVVYESDGYSNCGKTGSGKPFNKTTHNGQDNGVCDLNGLMYEVAIGLTCETVSKNITGASKSNPCQITAVGHGLVTGDTVEINSIVGMTQLNSKMYKVTWVSADIVSLDACDSSAFTDYVSGGTITKGTFYILKESIDVRTITSGETLSTDHWGTLGYGQNFDVLDLQSMFRTVYPNNGFAQYFGATTNQVLSSDLTGTGKKLRDLGFPKDPNGWGAGTTKFGSDMFYQKHTNKLCVIRSSNWNNSTNAGVWYVNLNNNRTNSNNNVGFRCDSFPQNLYGYSGNRDKVSWHCQNRSGFYRLVDLIPKGGRKR